MVGANQVFHMFTTLSEISNHVKCLTLNCQNSDKKVLGLVELHFSVILILSKIQSAFIHSKRERK